MQAKHLEEIVRGKACRSLEGTLQVARRKTYELRHDRPFPREIEPRHSVVGFDERQIPGIGEAYVVIYDVITTSASHPGQKLYSYVMKHPAEIQHRIGGLKPGHPGNACVDFVEHDVDTRVRSGVKPEVFIQLAVGLEFPKTAHYPAQLHRRNRFGVSHRVSRFCYAILCRTVHVV